MFGYETLTCFTVGHYANAVPAVVQGDGPKPAVLVRLDEDVAVVGTRKPTASDEVSIHCQVLKKGVPTPQVQTPAQQPSLSAGVNDEVYADAARVPVLRPEAYPGSSFSVPDNLHHPMAFAHIDTQGTRVLQQDLVEQGAPYLVGVGILGVGFSEVPTPRSAVAAP